jgi:hypothetical protein
MSNYVSRKVEMRQVISDWARYTIQRLQKSLDKKKVGITGSLNYSLLYQLAGIADGNVSSVSINFNYYGKFVDMGVGRGHKIESVKSNRDVYSLIGGGRRPKKWLSKTLYGEIAALREIMAIHYGEEGAQIVKETISQTIQLAA